MSSKSRHLATTLALTFVLWLPGGAGTAFSAGGKGSAKRPDFTRGGKIPRGYVHDWTLGPTGLRGWIYSNGMETSEARQIRITQVDKNSPSDGILEVGDVILGIGEVPFDGDPRVLFGKAISEAEKEKNKGALKLLRWRKGKTESIVVQLLPLGSYSATTPWDCEKTQQILDRGLPELAKRIKAPDYNPISITRSLNALALLASGREEYLPLVKKEAQWAAEYSTDGFKTWHYSYVIMLLAEYTLATGDESVLPGLRRLALESARGQSKVGSWGHRFAQGDGRLMGYGMMNAPGVPLTISLVLARKAGISDPEISEAIKKSARLLRFYEGKGSIPYGDHQPWIQTHDDNGKNGMAAILFSLLGETDTAEYFSRTSVASHGPERDGGHTGNFFNMIWALPAVAQSGPQASGAWMKEFGGWYLDLARQWDGTFLHQGPPSNKNDSYHNWDCTGAWLLAYAIPGGHLHLTGQGKSALPQIDAETAQSLIEDGRGWSNNDRESYYDALSTDQLIERLSNWSPTVRERAGLALGRSKDKVSDQLTKLLSAPDLYTRYGACQAIKMQGARGAAAVPALTKALESEDLWLRILASQALAGIGPAAKPAVPEMLEQLSQADAENDPRNMQQRYLSFALFNQRGGLIGKSLEGINRPLLLKAVQSGLTNEDGRARSSFSSVYRNLKFEEIEPLLPAIHQAIVEPAPSGIMFADGIRTSGLELFTKHKVSEGIELLADYARNQKKHGSQKRIIQIMSMLEEYGAHGQRVIPQLKKAADYFENEEKDFPPKMSLDKARIVRETISRIEASKDRPELIQLSL